MTKKEGETPLSFVYKTAKADKIHKISQKNILPIQDFHLGNGEGLYINLAYHLVRCYG